MKHKELFGLMLLSFLTYGIVGTSFCLAVESKYRLFVCVLLGTGFVATWVIILIKYKK